MLDTSYIIHTRCGYKEKIKNTYYILHTQIFIFTIVYAVTFFLTTFFTAGAGAASTGGSLSVSSVAFEAAV